MDFVDIGGERGRLLILEVRVVYFLYWRLEGLLLILEVRWLLLLKLEVREGCC